MRSKAMRDMYMNKLRTNKLLSKIHSIILLYFKREEYGYSLRYMSQKGEYRSCLYLPCFLFKKIITTTSLKVIGDRFLKAVSSLCRPSLYITVSVKNNK